MKTIAMIFAILLSFAFAGAATAVPKGMKAEFNNSSMGKVTFDGSLHAEKGFKCAECHSGTFEMERKAQIKMEDHQGGKTCFTCHADGGKAFTPKDNCTRCHVK